MTELITNEAIYEKFILPRVLQTRNYLWIGTADIKDMHVRTGRVYEPFLKILAGLVENGVEVRLLHAKEPGPRFRRDFDRFPALLETERFERLLCPRVHFKCMIVDGRQAFIGSANLTGAGMGARNPDTRNFEAGIVTDEKALIDPMMELFDRVFMGEKCLSCRMRDVCPDPIQ
ncbi:MAG: phospholipase [Leptospiraceae bacterium]|nr:phospholipase [Leptospiraceae bacterium]